MADRPPRSRRLSRNRNRTWRVLRCLVRNAERRTQRWPIRLLVAICVLVALWQFSFFVRPGMLDSHYRNTGSTGRHWEGRFAYFYYYLNLMPVASTNPDPPMSKEGAKQFFETQGETLVQDINPTWMSGEFGKIFPHLFHAAIQGKPESTSYRPFSAFLFTTSLLALLVAFWWRGRPLLGLLLTILLGSNPFQVFEVYGNENVHGTMISIAIWMLALHAGVLTRKMIALRWLFAVAIVSGLLLATVRTGRSEPATLILSAMATYLAYSAVRWRLRLVLCGLLLVTFVGTSQAWSAYFNHKVKESAAELKRVGGHPFPFRFRIHHHFWHPVWCGLGDFDQTHGYEWDDHKGVAYAGRFYEQRVGEKMPILARGPEFSFTKLYDRSEYYDDARMYKKYPSDVDAYDDILKEKVVHDIAEDPAWYLGILARRAWRIVSDTCAIRLTTVWGAVPIPFGGLAAIAVCFLFAGTGAGLFLRLCAFTLPTCITPFVIYSGGGIHYYAIFHFFAAAAVLLVALRAVDHWRIQRKRRIA